MNRVTAAYPAAAPTPVSAPDDPWIGREIGGEFRLVERIGAGVQGTVYRALQQPFDRPVAVKLLTGPKARDPQYRMRFLREARALELLRHPGVVRLLRYGTVRAETVEGDGLYIAEALVEGISLERVIDREGPLDASRALRIAGQVLDILAVAHREGVVHRDIKPAHIMLTADTRGDERVTLIDFGLARREHGFDEDDEELTRAGWMLGSPLYMAPEPLCERVAGPAADQYSLGIVLYEMLTGRPPFDGTMEKVLLSHATEPPPALPGRLDPTGALDALIRRALSKEPQRRYPDPEAMGAAIAEALYAVDRDGRTLVQRPGPELLAAIACWQVDAPGASGAGEPRSSSATGRVTRNAPSRPARAFLVAVAVGASAVLGSAAAAASLFF